MKLTQSQYQSLAFILTQHGIDINSVSLIKKKGRIRIQLASMPTSFFEFFRRKSVVHQWENSEHFEITDGTTKQNVGNWEGVLVHFKAWLGRIG